MQLSSKDKVDILAVQAPSPSTMSPEVLTLVKRAPTSILVWRDMEARAAQLKTLSVAEVPEDS